MTANLSSSRRDYPVGNNSVSPVESESQALIDVLQKIVQNTGALFEIDNCSIALLDVEKNTLVTLANLQDEGRKARQTGYQVSVGVSSWVAEHREALISNNVSLDPRFGHADLPLTGSIACVPLIDKDNFIGALTVSSPAMEAFSPHTLHLLTIFAEQAVLTIVNVRQAEFARQDAARLKANFLSMITHELRSPLNAINGYLDLALEGIAGELNEQQREFIQRARAGSEHLYAVIEDLLLISRADAGHLRLNRDTIHLPEIVASTLEELELIAKDNGVITRVDIADDFPPIYADAVRMQQVLRNLIVNALRFTPPAGGVIISARVINKRSDTVSAESAGTNAEQRQIEVQVRDTGYGIAPEYQERIFERFYQIPLENAGRTGGQGLGLAIVKMIVELHGGQVAIESIPGAGSTFKFTLPLL